jgi:hypothetical protein
LKAPYLEVVVIKGEAGGGSNNHRGSSRNRLLLRILRVEFRIGMKLLLRMVIWLLRMGTRHPGKRRTFRLSALTVEKLVI